MYFEVSLSVFAPRLLDGRSFVLEMLGLLEFYRGGQGSVALSTLRSRAQKNYHKTLAPHGTPIRLLSQHGSVWASEVEREPKGHKKVAWLAEVAGPIQALLLAVFSVCHQICSVPRGQRRGYLLTFVKVLCEPCFRFSQPPTLPTPMEQLCYKCVEVQDPTH